MHNRYLETLGLQPGATKSDIKTAFRRLSKIYHPDVNKHEDAKAQFIAIHEAYKFLTDVGPKPNHETIGYDYDPNKAAYEAWRRKAREYAWNKAREAQRQQQYQLKLLLKYFNYFAAVFFAFNALLAIDFLLPRETVEEEIVGLAKVYDTGGNRYRRGSATYSYDDVFFKDLSMRLDRGEAAGLSVGDEAKVVTTSIFKKPLQAEFVLGMEVKKVNQIYGIYQVFGVIIPIMLIILLLYGFCISTLDHKLTLAILSIVLFVVQVFLFFST